MPGKPWTLEEEKRCKEMLEAGEPLEAISQSLGRNQDAILVKAKRCGWKLPAASTHTTTMLELEDELMEPKEALKVLQAALKASNQAGLDRVEVQRLMTIATLARTYNELYKDYERLEEVEKKIIAINKKIDALEAVRDSKLDARSDDVKCQRGLSLTGWSR